MLTSLCLLSRPFFPSVPSCVKEKITLHAEKKNKKKDTGIHSFPVIRRPSVSRKRFRTGNGKRIPILSKRIRIRRERLLLYPLSRCLRCSRRRGRRTRPSNASPEKSLIRWKKRRLKIFQDFPGSLLRHFSRSLYKFLPGNPSSGLQVLSCMQSPVRHGQGGHLKFGAAADPRFTDPFPGPGKKMIQCPPPLGKGFLRCIQRKGGTYQHRETQILHKHLNGIPFPRPPQQFHLGKIRISFRLSLALISGPDNRDFCKQRGGLTSGAAWRPMPDRSRRRSAEPGRPSSVSRNGPSHPDKSRWRPPRYSRNGPH